jgi:heat shock protein HtpX
MATVQSATQPSFEFGRIGRNRSAYVLAVILLVAALAPMVLAGAYGITDLVFRLTGSRTASAAIQMELLASQVRDDERELAEVKNLPPEDDDNWLDVGLAKEQAKRIAARLPSRRAELARSRAELAASVAVDRSYLIKLMPAATAALAAILGLLYWGTCSSPTVRLLANIGTLPAGAAEAGTTRLLEDLCARVHLPPPKLYVIQSGVPYTLCAATDSHTAMLAVTRGALDLLDQRELEVLLAHEISHIGNRDIRLNALLASVTLFIRLPLSALRRWWTAPAGTLAPADDGTGVAGLFMWRWGFRRILFMGALGILLLPLLIYVFFVAPIVGHLIRAIVSHDREFMADADAARLTGNPEGLVSALAKIGGATAGLCDSNPAFQHSCVAGANASGGWLSSSFKPTHPSPAKRIQRLVQVYGAARFAGLQGAIETGKQYAGGRENKGEDNLVQVAQDDLTAIRQGNTMGRVCRLLGSIEVPVYESHRPNSLAIARLKPGELFVVFDDLGKLLPVNTAKEVYGYIDRRTKMKAIPSILPQEVYDPKARAAAEAELARREAAAPLRPAASTQGPLGLTRDQLWVVAGFAAAVFAGITILLVVAAGSK